MSSQFYISGQLGRAIYGDGGKYYVVAAENPSRSFECRPQDLSTFFRYGAEFAALPDVSPDGIAAALKSRTKAHRALSLVVSGFDNELDNDTRALAIEASEELLRERQVYDFVHARLLARPVPDGADLEVAGLLAEYKKSTAVKSLYDDMLGARDAIPALLESWHEIALEHFTSRDEQETAERLLTEAGVFSDLALALAGDSLTSLSNIIIKYGLSPELKAYIPHIPHILNALRVNVTERGLVTATGTSVENERHNEPLSIVSKEKRRGFDIRELLKSLRRGREKRRVGTLTTPEVKDKVDRQILAIEEQLHRGNLSRAERYLQDLIRFHVAHGDQRKHVAMSLCSLAKTAMDFNAFDMAETMISHASSLGLDDVVIWNTRAELLKHLGHLSEALAIYDEAVELYPNNNVARSGRAEVLKEMGRLDEALAAYDETIRTFPENVVARTGRAEVLKEMGRLDEALAAYDEAERLFPDNVFAHTGRAEVLKKTGRLDEALAAYEETIRTFPENVVARSGRAEVLKEMGRLTDALDAYDEAARLFPDNVFARSGRAEVLKETGRLADALDAYDGATARFPQNVVARNGRAEVLREMGRLDEALAAYDEAIALFPENAVARSGRAEVLKEMGRLADALDAYDEVAGLFPENAVALSGRAEVLKETGRFADALDAYDEAARLFPQDVFTRSGRAEVLREMGRLDEALQDYEEAARLFPQNAVVRNGRANILMLLGRIEEARALLTVERPASYEDWVGYHIVAMSYIKTKEIDETIRRLTYGLNNNPWARNKAYYATALGVARIRRSQFAEAEEVLKTNVVNLNAFQKQKRLALLGHAQAAGGKRVEAAASLASIGHTANKHLNTLRGDLIVRFDVPVTTETVIPTTEAAAPDYAALDRRIEEEEFYLAMAA